MIAFTQALFVHSHRLSDGSVVTHAHPFKAQSDENEPFKTHEHSKFEVTLLDNLNQYLITSLVVVAVILSQFIAKLRADYTFVVRPIVVFHPALRAPPCYSFCGVSANLSGR
jgi:hypothetical protein